jgi:hypothetical protein
MLKLLPDWFCRSPLLQVLGLTFVAEPSAAEQIELEKAMADSLASATSRQSYLCPTPDVISAFTWADAPLPKRAATRPQPASAHSTFVSFLVAASRKNVKSV